ncbi:AAA family ATPase, partial [Nitratifractor sp.]
MRRFRWDNLKIAAAGVALLVILGLVLALRDNTRLISGEQLKVLMRKQLVTRVVLDEPYLYVRTARMRYKVPARGIDLAEVADRYPLEVRGSHPLAWLTALLGLLALGGGALWLLRRRQGSEPGSLVEGEPLRESASAETVAPTRSTVRFRDVAGMEDVKADLAEIIDFLRHPGKYRKLDVRLPKGVLLAGPPGVGKTWLAKAVAGEAGVPFFYQSGANIVEIYVGMGPKRVHELFQAAKRQAPSIVFIDEIDAVGKSRGEGRNDEREATLNQLLTEMDGFESGSGVIVMAATNRIEMLDPALLRPGRFDRRIHISLPDERERRAILELYLRKKPHALDLDRLAHLTVGFSPAALSTLVNEAALHALRRGSKRLEDADFEAVIEAVVSGKRKILSFSEEERRIQAVYQSAKALVATWYDVPF